MQLVGRQVLDVMAMSSTVIELAAPSLATPATLRILPQPGSRTPPQYDTWLVIQDLDDLRGPATGILNLPHMIHWGPLKFCDLSDTARRRSTYQEILREAANGEDLASLLNKGLLMQDWPFLALPPRLKAGWEKVHPELGGTLS